MATPNYKSPIGGLVLNRYDAQSHFTGTAFRHNSNQIDVSPPVDVNGNFYHNVADALAAMSALTSAATTLIFRPQGIANSNVYTSWTALMLARSFIQGPATIVIDSLASTAVAIGSNGAILGGPPITIHVGSTVGFAAPPSTINVVSSAGVQTVNYTGITSSSFTGCSGGAGILATGDFIYQNVLGATIDTGTWDLNGNTDIVGNLYGSALTTYTSELIIPDGARLLNPVAFRNLIIETTSTNPSGAIDIGPPFTVYQIEFSNVTITGFGSGPCMNAQPGSINLNNFSNFFASGSPPIIGGTLITTLNVYINDGSNVLNNSFNISGGGTATAYINSMAATCGSTQPGVNVQGLTGDVNGAPNTNIITNISGDGINPININTRVLQWSASVGTPVTITQAQSISGSGASLDIIAQQAASSSNGNGGSIVIKTGAKDGAGAQGSIQLLTDNSLNSLTVGPTTITISSGTVIISSGGSNQITTSSTTVTIGEGGANTSTVFQVGGATNLTLTTSLLQWGAVVPGPVTINQAKAVSGGGGQLVIAAQAAATSSNADGGILELTSGVGDGSGAPGSILLLTGDFHNGAVIAPGQIDFLAGSSVILEMTTSAVTLGRALVSTPGGLALGTSVAMDLTAGGTITLSSAQYKFPYLIFNGTLPNNTTIVLPANTGSKWIIDATGVTLAGHTITLKANSNNWGTTIGITNLYEVTYGGTAGKLYGVTLSP